MDRIEADGIAVVFDPTGGVIDDLVIDAAGAGATRQLRPLHRAPWHVNQEALPDSIAPIERRLAGDFFCVPFGYAGEGVPIHGWAANGSWEGHGLVTDGDGAVTASYGLRQTILGARLSKHITLCPGHPIVYQRHEFAGGAGLTSAAHHVMLHVPGGARLSFSPKLGGNTPSGGLEEDPARGRSILAYPQRFEHLSSVLRADGAMVDASLYPFEWEHEDLVVLSEAPGAGLGWSAAVAAKDGFVFFAVKEASVLPQTVLWMSNGGRYYPPWNGRHLAVLGIEEAATGLHLAGNAEGGAAAALAAGIALAAGRTTSIRYAFGAIPAPRNWTRISDVAVRGQTITLTDAGGDTRTLPFRGMHFGVE